MKILITILLVSALTCHVHAQSNDNLVNKFFEALITDSDSVKNFIAQDDLMKSERLGISYINIKNKFLIGFDIDTKVKEAIKLGEQSYDLKFEKIDDQFSKVEFRIEKINYSKSFYFKEGKFISPTTFFAEDWGHITSNYFNIYYSHSTLVNDYAIKELDKFVDRMCNVLGISPQDKKQLSEDKINYFLCKDADEIEKISGFNTRGLYILAFDEIISTYNFHVHEICHLLINYKIKNLPLFTLPIFQEGFATLYGGRGGLGANVLSDIGYFLLKSNFLSVNSILTKKDFMKEDASLTYPISSIYNAYIIRELGIEKYLELYKTNSGDENFISSLQPNLSSYEIGFNKFIDEYSPMDYIRFQSNSSAELFVKTDSVTITANGEFYEFLTTSNVLLGNKSSMGNYLSKKFSELYPGYEYSNQKYLITVDKSEINVYNLFTNNLIASYSSGFSLNPQSIRSEDGAFKFSIRKNIFDEDLSALQLFSIKKKVK